MTIFLSYKQFKYTQIIITSEASMKAKAYYKSKEIGLLQMGGPAFNISESREEFETFGLPTIACQAAV